MTLNVTQHSSGHWTPKKPNWIINTLCHPLYQLLCKTIFLYSLMCLYLLWPCFKYEAMSKENYSHFWDWQSSSHPLQINLPSVHSSFDKLTSKRVSQQTTQTVMITHMKRLTSDLSDCCHSCCCRLLIFIFALCRAACTSSALLLDAISTT